MTLQGEHDNRRGYLEKFHDVAEIKQDVLIIIKYFFREENIGQMR